MVTKFHLTIYQNLFSLFKFISILIKFSVVKQTDSGY